MTIDMSQFNDVFFEESQEHLDEMEHLLMELDLNDPDPEALNSVFRAAHSIKGGSDIFGFKALTGLTHVMENLLDRARKQTIKLSVSIVDLLLEMIDVLKSILACYRNDSDIDWELVGTSTRRLEDAVKVTSEDEPVDESDNEGDFGFFESPIIKEEVEEFGFFEDPQASKVSASDDEDFGFFEDVENKDVKEESNDDEEGFGFFDQDEPALEEKAKADDKEVVQSNNSEPPAEITSQEKEPSNSVASVVKSVPNPVANDAKVVEAKANDVPATTKPAATPVKAARRPLKPVEKTPESSTIRVETSKVDTLVNLVGELVITQSMLAMIEEEVDEGVSEKMLIALVELERNTREIQEAVMSIRMLPISFVFNRFPRLVRDLSSKLNKTVDLNLEGATTEIDKSLIEKLADPLTHLVRNSIDHGIEVPEERAKAGKTAKGTITLKAQQKGGSILISIIDDGAGLNRERILNKAAENNIPLQKNFQDSDVWNLIFAPGFSTAAEVTDVSGRGVGMDVVKRNIESLGGRIEIESTAGQGTAFHIHLPLTLAIVDGMTVDVAGEIFVVPLVNIIESIQPDQTQIRLIKNEPLLWVRGEYWPIIPLGSCLSVSNAIEDPSKGIVVLVESAKKRFGLLVDDLVGQQQVVIKSLERHYKRVPGVAGATIMGDGSVAMILDVESLSHSVTSQEYVQQAEAI
ncbi:chemotaxis protein CheA [Marinomonas sp. SBI22]|uniref:chemotaxis protein CheA n=1 Tax=unclassified Marinomonas TaxID=196814 RepID=UPI0007AF38F0|nr:MULTISPECIES: chemotaxis protein CheW [unclassified Marinomonas]KZM44096.1 chemotaxis protein CheA [Marinomonas sp. SBI22]KZM45256.1 chemotaxis protein CheA [Marinomonas sp. SBI8L]